MYFNVEMEYKPLVDVDKGSYKKGIENVQYKNYVD